MSKHFTLTLSDEGAARIKELTRIFGGSVPAFAAGLAEDISRLPASEIARLRQEVIEKARDYELAKNIVGR